MFYGQVDRCPECQSEGRKVSDHGGRVVLMECKRCKFRWSSLITRKEGAKNV